MTLDRKHVHCRSGGVRGADWRARGAHSLSMHVGRHHNLGVVLARAVYLGWFERFDHACVSVGTWIVIACRVLLRIIAQ